MRRNSRAVQTHSIAGGFVFFLLALFAGACCVLTAFGVRAYRHISSSSAAHNEERILTAYVRGMIRSEDTDGLVAVQTMEDMPVLTLRQTYSGRVYETRIYAYGGSLREWFSEADRTFAPESGEVICPCSSFTPRLEDKLLILQMQATPQSEALEVRIRVNAGSDGDEKDEKI